MGKWGSFCAAGFDGLPEANKYGFDRKSRETL